MAPSTKIAKASESSEGVLENGVACLSLTTAVEETKEGTAPGDADSALPSCPEWVAKRFSLPLAQVACVEVTSASRDLFKTLLEYCAHRAVDIDEPLPKPRKTQDGEPVPYTEREYDGRLSSIWNSPDASFDDGHNRSRRRGGGSLFGSLSATDSDSDSDDMLDDGPRMPEYQFGLGWARVEGPDGNDIYVRHFAKGAPISISNSPRFYRAIVLFARDREMARALCDSAVKWRHARVKNRLAAVPGRFVLYRLVTSGGGMPNWISHGHKRSRALSSIILPHGQLDSIIGDFKEFARKDTRRWYELHGLPYRRSYLFYGPPGVGKTSTIRALAGTLKLSACFLGLTQRDFSNQTLQDALLTIPKPSILVLEDVDVLFNEDRKSETHTALTFSGLLNALDGLVSGEGTLTIMTTNHIQKLDPALIRAGRVDRRFEFGIPSREQIEDLFASFYPKAPRTLAQQFADAVFERPEKEARSIATLQQHFIFTRRSSAEESVKAIPKFFAEYYPYSAHAGDSSLYT